MTDHMDTALECSRCHVKSLTLANDPHAWDNWLIRVLPFGPAHLCPKCAGTERKSEKGLSDESRRTSVL